MLAIGPIDAWYRNVRGSVPLRQTRHVLQNPNFCVAGVQYLFMVVSSTTGRQTHEAPIHARLFVSPPSPAIDSFTERNAPINHPT